MQHMYRVVQIELLEDGEHEKTATYLMAARPSISKG
jgi:hypothetical protein